MASTATIPKGSGPDGGHDTHITAWHRQPNSASAIEPAETLCIGAQPWATHGEKKAKVFPPRPQPVAGFEQHGATLHRNR